jgi:integrase
METIPKMPEKLVIFKVECSRYWWARVYMYDRYFVKSTKTEVRKEAQAFAKQLYEDALQNKGVNPRSKTKTRLFAGLALALLDIEKTTAKKSLYQNDKGKIENFLIPHFGEKLISDIEYSDLVVMMEELKKKGLSPATKKQYLSLVSKVFKYAVQENVIKFIPPFPKLSERLKTKEKRDFLENGEYVRLNNAVLRLEAKGVKVRGIPVTEELKWLNKFMINAFLRPSDIKVLKHKHIQRKSETDENGRKVEWLVLNHPATKTTGHAVQAMPKIVPAYESLISFRKKEHDRKLAEAKAITGKDKYGKDKRQKALVALEGSPYLKPDDYVFFPEYKNRSTMMGIWGKLFREVLKESKLKELTGKNIQLYSLRHTAIMFRLMRSNVDTLILAKNARTSQGVIEQFYGSHLTTDQARRQLHSYLPVKRSKKKLEVEVIDPADDDFNQD